jgi:hypothetical protein
MKTLIVVGDFNDAGGRVSSFGREFIKEYRIRESAGEHTAYNGGRFEDLERIVFADFDTIIWFANVPNDKPKLIREVKKNNPTCMLVTSKRNNLSKYDFAEIINRALQTKSNLLVEFKLESKGTFIDYSCITSSVYDPLGNCFLNGSSSIPLLVDVLVVRLESLRSFTRQKSIRIGETLPFPKTYSRTGFLEIARKYANKFHKFLPTTDRFVGNASFRCADGFPSFRDGRLIFVSKRNIDKCDIDEDGFVAVRRGINCIEYYGDNKPSVDTPIQLALYDNYHHINYMIHSHAYVKDAPTVTKVIPCGALQEFIAVRDLVPHPSCNWFFVNLLGHGSVCAAEKFGMLANIQYIPRPLPEIHDPWDIKTAI